MTKFQEMVTGFDHITRVHTSDGTQMFYRWYLNSDGLKAGINWYHELPSGEACGGQIPILYTGEDDQVWRVESYYPLSLQPSIICVCHLHGFIAKDRWVYV